MGFRMTLIKPDQPSWDVFVETVLDAYTTGEVPDDVSSQDYFQYALEALLASMRSDYLGPIAEGPLDEFGIKYLHLGQS